MTTLKRRPNRQVAPPQSPESGADAKVPGRPPKGTPPIRMQDAVAAHYKPREFYDPRVNDALAQDPAGAAARAIAAYMKHSVGEARPYCTCASVKGWSFDCQIGVYLHAVVGCWRPSKAMFEAAVLAGILDAK